MDCRAALLRVVAAAGCCWRWRRLGVGAGRAGDAQLRPPEDRLRADRRSTPTTRCESCHHQRHLQGHAARLRDLPRRGHALVARQRRQCRRTTCRPQQACDTCHNTQTFVGAKFNHVGVAPGTCQSCHNGTHGAGQDQRTTSQTSASCDSCHRTSAWTPAAGLRPRRRGARHLRELPRRQAATGKSAHAHAGGNASQLRRLPHAPSAAGGPTAWNHTQMAVTAQCATCHSGGFPPADGRPANHVPVRSRSPARRSANCDSCHKGGFSTWANGALPRNVGVGERAVRELPHRQLPERGGQAQHRDPHRRDRLRELPQRPPSWAGAKVDHSTFTAATNCTSCHNGSTATGKSAAHMPVGATNCVSCHSVSPALEADQVEPHPGGGHRPVRELPQRRLPAGRRPAGEPHPVPDASRRRRRPTATAATRAATPTWANGALPQQRCSVSTQLRQPATPAAYLPAVGKPNTAIHAGVTGNCESCHKTHHQLGAAPRSTTAPSPRPPTAPAATTAARPPASRPPTSRSAATNCFSCHNVSPAPGRRPSGTTRQVTVTRPVRQLPHRRLPAGRRPAGQPHPVPDAWRSWRSANCDSCHKGSYTSWANGTLPQQRAGEHAVRQLPHRRFPPAVGKPNNAIHAGVTGNCESCHKSHQQLGRRQGRPQHLHRGHQLRQLPQRQHGHRQAGQPHPGRRDQLLQLPQRQPDAGRRPSGTTPRSP